MRAVCTAAAFMLLLVLPLRAAETLHMAADNWCPYTCDSHSDKPGFMVEMLKAILEQEGYRLEYQTMPWERAVTEAVMGRLDGVIGIDHGEVAEPDILFNNIPGGQQQQVIAFRRGLAKQFHQLADLNSLSVGVVQGYHYTEEVDVWIESRKNQQHNLQVLRGENASQLNVQKLLAGRIDATIDARSVIEYFLVGVPEERRPEIVSVDPGTWAFYGFSTKFADAKKLIGIVDKGIGTMRASGAMAVILKRYGLTDWEASTQQVPSQQ